MANHFGLLFRRTFLKQTVAFSALAAATAAPAVVLPDSGEPNTELLVVGDWGWTNASEGQSSVAQGMREYVAKLKITPEALLLLGDSWYGRLEGGAKSPRWKAQFEDMYPREAFPGPAYTILGNHDYQNAPDSKVEAELEYAKSGRTDHGPTRWTLPARWYSFQLPAKNPLVTVIALDSNVSGTRSFGPGFFTMTDQMRLDQLAWFRTELAKTRSTPFLVVMGHHPLYSNGKHGDSETLIRDWDPLLRQHKVTAYLAGHDHDLQHLEFEGHPTSFFCSGAGGADLYNLRTTSNRRGPFAEKLFGFSHISVSSSLMTFQHLDSAGNVLHAYTKSVTGEVRLLQRASAA